ncbi:MAG: gluconate 2-dehydrogenase subunit 3 family protein [Chloroflexota bacterium]|nr:gluconate 2-dehydrogenase subunit 3 family protein [Chloroflexota bacterium]
MNVEPEVAGPQTEAAVTSRPAPIVAPAVLDEAQRALLRAILNRIVPARDDLPGAGDLDVGDSIERTLAASARLRRLFLDGLRAVELTAGSTHAFGDLDPASQTAVLETVEQNSAAFFVALVEHTYRGYYTLAAVQLAVGFEARPPQPLGHTLPPFDPALLDQQRRRTPFWRRTG